MCSVDATCTYTKYKSLSFVKQLALKPSKIQLGAALGCQMELYNAANVASLKRKFKQKSNLVLVLKQKHYKL